MNIRIDFQVGFVYKGAKGDYEITNIFDGTEEKMISFKVNGGAEVTLKYRTLYHRIRNFMSHNDMVYQGPTQPAFNVIAQPEPIQEPAVIQQVIDNSAEVESLRQQLQNSQEIISQQRQFISDINARYNENQTMFQQLMTNNQQMMEALTNQAATIVNLQNQITNLTSVVGNLTSNLTSQTQTSGITYHVSNEFCEYNLNTLDEVATMLNAEVGQIEEALRHDAVFFARGFEVTIA